MAQDDLNSLPEELSCRPVPLIGLSGLEIVKNSTHRYIWEAFNKNQNNGPVAVKIIARNHQFPRVKPSKSSVERSNPKGILKRNWMKKHYAEIPAVIVVFLSSNWDDSNWDTNKAQCEQQVRDVKAQIGQLGTKVAVVVVQRVPPLPAGEDSRGQERANAFCESCDIPIKQLFVVPQEEHLAGYVVRLQGAIHDLAKTYYTQEIKLVKDKLTALNKGSHRHLFVRYNFKIGFFYEFEQDDRSARTFYETAYSHIKDETRNDNNLFELKLVAGFISYKLCACMFRLGPPRDALTQFRRHIHMYKPLNGPALLLFEHYAWLANQYAAFASIFDEAIRLGLPAMQIEHPGIYYRRAALYTINRKIVAKQLCENAEFDGKNGVIGEYWGQRFGFDLASNRDHVKLLQAKERAVDHSALIIGFLGNGISQFKTYRCPRMRLHLLVQMAEEYHAARDHGKTLTLLSHMLWDYRNERWWMLLGALLQLGLSSAFLSAAVEDYLSLGFEALGAHVPFDPDLRMTIAHNIQAIIMRSETLRPHPGGTDTEISTALSLWSTTIANNTPITIDMSNVRTFIDLRVQFSQQKYPISQPIDFKLFLKLDNVTVLEIDSITATLTSDNQNLEIVAEERNVIIQNGNSVFQFSADAQFMAGCTVKVTAVLIQFKPRISLKITPPTNRTVVPAEFLRYRCEEELKNEALITSPIAAITVQVNHEAPALLGEQFPIHVVIFNYDTFVMHHTELDVKLICPSEESASDASSKSIMFDTRNDFLLARLSDEKETSISPRQIKVIVGTIPAGSHSSTTIFLKGYSTGDRNLQFAVRFSDSESDQQLNGLVEQQATIRVCNPFNVTTECLTTKFAPALTCYAYETFLLCTDVHITSPCPITIQHSTLELSVRTANENPGMDSQLEGITLNPGDTGRDIFPVTLLEAKDQPVAVGTYVLQWSREGQKSITSSSVTIKPIRCQQSVLSISLSLPAHGRVRTPMRVEYTLYNRTSMLLQLDMNMEASEAFMYSGPKQTFLRLLPDCEKKISYSLCPLWSGLLALPRMLLNSVDHTVTEQLSATLHRTLPSHVYVMPQEKIDSNSS